MSACPHVPLSVVDIDGRGTNWCSRCGAYRAHGKQHWNIPTDTQEAQAVADKAARDERIIDMAGEIAMDRALARRGP